MKPRKRPVQFPVKMVTRISRETAKALTRGAKDCGSPNVAEYVRDILDIHLGNHRVTPETRLLLRYMVVLEYKITAVLRFAGGLTDSDLARVHSEACRCSADTGILDSHVTQLLNSEREAKADG